MYVMALALSNICRNIIGCIVGLCPGPASRRSHAIPLLSRQNEGRTAGSLRSSRSGDPLRTARANPPATSTSEWGAPSEMDEDSAPDDV
jgi:hypothetical protein